MRNLIIVFAVALSACSGTANKASEESFSPVGQWNNVLDLSNADTTEFFVKTLQEIVDRGNSDYHFFEDGSGEARVYENAELINEMEVKWSMSGDTLTIDGEQTYRYVLTASDKFQGLKVAGKEYGIDHYLTRKD